MIDIEQFQKEIRDAANEYLSEITEENLKDFAEKTKWITNKYIQNYYVEKETYIIGDDNFGIKDESVKDQFMDLVDGYRAKMEQWVANNSIQIREVKIQPASLEDKCDKNNKNTDFQSICEHIKNNKPIYLSTAGMLVACGVFIFSELWVALAVELLFLSSSIYCHYNDKKEKTDNSSTMKEEEIEFKKAEIEMQKERMINGIISDLKVWMKNGLKYSHQLIESYGVRSIDESEFI